MLILIHSATNKDTISDSLGQAEYSYYFVLKEYRPVLEAIGTVVEIRDPAREVDAHYRAARKRGQACIFLSFSPPHHTQLKLECPTVPVFAWEFSSIPDQPWGGNELNDWRIPLSRLGCAITHSSFTVEVVRKAMGTDFPVVSVPAPVWDRFAAISSCLPASPLADGVELVVDGLVLDSRDINLQAYAPKMYRTGTQVPLDRPAQPSTLRLDGVIYTSVLNPNDGRKNWEDLLGVFCWHFRDVEDATLVLKITFKDAELILREILHHIYMQTPIKCRVVLIHGFLSDPDYERLVQATSYVVNSSHGEGQCLPLMEFMACGKPGIAPLNTAMLDYITPQNAFPIECGHEPTFWPHDPRQAFRTLRYPINWDSLLAAYRDSYEVAKNNPERYASLSEQARIGLRDFCSQDLAKERLQAFFSSILATRQEPA